MTGRHLRLPSSAQMTAFTTPVGYPRWRARIESRSISSAGWPTVKKRKPEPMAEGSIFAEQDAKVRARRIHSRIEELMLAIERYHEMLENFEERLLEIGQEVRATP